MIVNKNSNQSQVLETHYLHYEQRVIWNSSTK